MQHIVVGVKYIQNPQMCHCAVTVYVSRQCACVQQWQDEVWPSAATRATRTTERSKSLMANWAVVMLLKESFRLLEYNSRFFIVSWCSCFILINEFCYPGWPCLVCAADAHTHSDHSVCSQPDDGFQSSIQPQPQTVRPNNDKNVHYHGNIFNIADCEYKMSAKF